MAFQGRLVAGVGKSLRIYDIGKKKLLRKVENKVPFLLNNVRRPILNRSRRPLLQPLSASTPKAPE